MKFLAILADDLSSATDCGIQVTRSGLQTTVHLGEVSTIPDSNSIEVISLDLDSRSVAPEEAYRRAKEAAQAVTARGYTTLYKSIDSTLRGNLCAEVEGVLDCTDVDFAVIAPAFPFYGRTTLDGWHYLNGIMINQTEFASDPQTPVKEANLVKLFSTQSKRKVGLVNLETLRRGSAPVAAQMHQLKHQGVEQVVFDVQTEADLDAVVQAVASSNYRVLWVGSTGLARCVPQALPLHGKTNTPVVRSSLNGKTMLVAGSASEVTHRQLAQYQIQPGIVSVEMDPLQIINGGQQEKIQKVRCTDHLVRAIQRGKDVVLHVRSSRSDIAAAKALGQELHLTGGEVSTKIACALAQVTAQVAHLHPLKGLILTGGDTAKAVCQELKVTGIQILEEVEPGIPIGRLLGPREMLVVTKAGAFGTPLALVNSLQAIQKG